MILRSFCALALLFLSTSALAQLRFSISPIVGYEDIQKVLPYQHRTTRLFYGARVTAGFLMLSGEGEYTRANDTEVFSSPAETMTEQADKLKLGLRSTLSLSSMVYLSIRGGGQATQTMRDTTIGGVTTRTWDPIIWLPYGGAGFRFQLSPKIFATAEMVVVWTNFPDMNSAEYQPTAGFQIALP